MELLNPTNYLLFIGAQSHEGIELSNTEKYYNVRYHVSELSNKLTTDFCQDESMLSYFHLPKPNVFPDDISVPEPTGPRPKLDKTVPTLLKYNDCLEQWYKQDDKFYLPKCVIKMEIKSPVINFSPRNRVMFDLLRECWCYILAKELYNSRCAGLSYSISSSYTAANITVEGFSQKLPLLLEQITSNMRHVVVKESIFNNCRHKLQEDFSYCRLASAISQASSWERFLLLYSTWHITLIEECLKDVTYEMLNNFLHTLFDQVHITMFVTENFTEQQGMDTAFNVQNIINGHPLSSCEIPHAGSLPLYSTNPLPDCFFNQLRTKEQLDFTVDSSVSGYSNGNDQLTMSFQGECNSIYLSLRITEFLRTYCQYIVDFDKETLDNTIKSLTITLNAQIKSIGHESSRMWGSIESGHYDFENATDTDGSLDNAVGNLLKLYLVPQELAQQPSADNIDDNSSNFGYCSSSCEPSPIPQEIRIGLQMALESAANPPDYHKHSTVNFANIGMCQTHEGIWVIDDISKFQRSQRSNGLSMPFTKLIPKYKD
ncbi:hypothetical protein COEREDRAFT_9331 [Coemansia reversa NRRL 1564]|uniref:Uncharacterized protein n=1 Tax=Coemansia reversa (strain ATCC 12441 / NRRL 1564) TaxID=763665 RepID=A0A2G5B8S4_COERN|nr:hypothetical protein COEREDRAFT_9331 [Coemansia reversa NRRL 1564]|eukprot:PIA15390.1 hypothetical protein COEREDRAFT_9331 [Coemansia reversa NRRL 1564]